MPDQTVNVYIVGHNRLGTAASAAESSLTRLASRMQTIGSTMTRFVTLPIVAGFALAAREANEAIKVTGQTEAVLRSTGGVANVTAREVSNLADSLSRKTAIDDEVIQSGENMLLTFTKIRNEAGKGNDIFNQATEIITDMGAVFGDVEQQAVRVGKALQDPVLGVTALRRVGVNLNDQQREQIRLMVESGDLMGAQKLILSELRTEFGGAAGAMATPWDKFLNKMRQVGEEVGMKAMPLLERLGDIVITLGDAFLGLPDWAQTFVVGGAAVLSAVGPLLQLGAAMLKVSAATTSATGAASGFLSNIGTWGPALGLATAGIIGLAAGLDRAMNENWQFGLTARDVAAMTQRELQGIVALTYADGVLADTIRDVANASPDMARKIIQAAEAAGVSGKDLDRYRAIVRGVESGNRALENSFKGAADGANALQTEAQQIIDASLGLEGAQIGYNRAIERYVQVVTDANSSALDRQEAEFGVKQAIDRVAQAALEQTGTTEGQIGALTLLMGTLDPGSPLQLYLQDYINKLGSVPSDIHTNITSNAADVAFWIAVLQERLNNLPREVTIAINANPTGFLPGVGAAIQLPDGTT